MPSRRLPWSAEPNALTVLRGEKLLAGTPILDLTVTNPTRAGIAYPESELLRAIADPALLRYEPTPRGPEAARAAVGALYGVGAECVLLTASTSEAYALLFKMLCDPGDVVLVPQPGYPLFDHLAALEGVSVRPWQLDLDAGWASRIPRSAGGAKALVAVSPNNPTGSCLEPAALDDVARLGIPLISDEVFSDYAFAPLPPPARSRTDIPVFTLGGLSKSAGLPQLKLGWIVATGPGAPQALDRLAAAADAYLSPSAPVLCAAPRLLELAPRIREGIRARLQANLAVLRAVLPESLRAPLGGWSAVLELPAERTDEEWALALLRTDGVLVHPGYFYGFPREAFLVVSLLTPEETFRAGCGRIASRL